MPTGITTVRAMLEDENGVLSDVSTVLYTCVYLPESQETVDGTNPN